MTPILFSQPTKEKIIGPLSFFLNHPRVPSQQGQSQIYLVELIFKVPSSREICRFYHNDHPKRNRGADGPLE